MWIAWFPIGLGLFSFPVWLGPDHLASLATRLALVMALGMVKDIVLPDCGPAVAAPHPTHGAVLQASGGGATRLARLALHNLVCIAPLVAQLAAVGNHPVLGTIGRWNRANSLWVEASIAPAAVAISLALRITLSS